MKNILNLLLTIVVVYGCTNKQPKDDNPFANDTPKPVSGKISLAGSPEPDIVRFLKVQDARYPSISPDGKWVAYRTRLTGEFQVWVTRTDKLTAPIQITYGNSVTFHKWSPDNKGILYATDMEGNEKVGFYFISKDGMKEKELLAPSDAFRFFGDFNKDGSQFTYSTTERNGNDFDIHIYDLASDADTKVYEGKLGYYPISFSPDGRFVVIAESVGEDANNLFLLDVLNSTLSQINDEGDPSNFENILWKSDGQSFYMITNYGEEFNGVAMYTIEDQSMEYIFQDTFDVEQIISKGKNSIHMISNQMGYSVHSILDVTNGNASETHVWPKGRYSLTASKDGAKLVAHIRSPKTPGDLWYWTDELDNAVRITQSSNAGIDLDKMVLPEAHSFTARDGLEVHGLLYSPQNKNPNTPLVIRLHGGPTAQARPEFRALPQYLVSRGFVIFDLNYRGSTGYGKTYARENNLRKREAELNDLEDAVKYLSDKGIASPHKTAIMGGSYGGYLTMAAMTRLPEVFKCGVSFVGVSNWITALEGASPQLKASDRLEYGDINDNEDRKFFESISPIKYIDQVKSPVMVIHGANDPRDPVTESDMFVNGIRSNGGEVAYLRFPDEGHSIRKMKNRITAYVRVAEFLEKNLN